MNYIRIQRYSNIPGMEWSATRINGSGGVSFYGQTANEAEAKLKALVDCEGLEVERIDNPLYRVEVKTTGTGRYKTSEFVSAVGENI